MQPPRAGARPFVGGLPRVLFGLCVCAVPLACGSSQRPAPPPSAPRAAAAMVEPLDRSRWVPTSADRVVVSSRLPDGTVRGFVGRLRVERTPSGAVRRASQLLPASRPAQDVVPMPARLGGGYLFVSFSTGTEIHRATSFLGPVARIARATAQNLVPIPGPDSLLLRYQREGRVVSLDLETGAEKPTRGLPDLPSVTAVAFADASRGLVFGDVVGGLLTVDGGASWTHVDVPDAFRGISLDGPDFLVGAMNGRFRVATDGSVTEEPEERSFARPRDGSGPPANLERLVLHGWPVGDGTALLLDERGLSRHRLDDGDLLARSPVEVGSGTTCSAFRLFSDVGFACARAEGTTLFQLDPPLGVREVMKLPPGTSVVAQPNGAVVVGATCAGGRARGAHCVLFPDGARREIAARGDVGRERVAALTGNRVVVLVPPLGDQPGRVTVIGPRGAPTVRPLDVTEGTLASAGTWLTGFVEGPDDTVTGWVEAPRALQGISIELSTGRVTSLGPPRSEVTVALVGREALVLDAARGQLHETLDGGARWARVELPEVGADGVLPGATLRCGPLGCLVELVSGTWARVGWGPRGDAEDLREPEALETLERPTARRIVPTLRCTIPPLPTQPATAKRGLPAPKKPESPLPAFHGVPGPEVPKGWTFAFERAIGAGPAILYGLAPKGAGERGRLLARLRHPFGGPSGLVGSTAVTLAPFRDEAELGDFFGTVGPGIVMHAVVDPRGRTSVLSLCRASREDCDLLLAKDGQPVTPLRITDGEISPRVMAPGSTMIEAGDKVFVGTVLASQYQVRVFDGRESRVAMLAPRASSLPLFPVMTARRDGRAGVLLRGTGTSPTESWYVVPLDDPDRLPTRLIPTSLSNAGLRACTPSDDGWLIDLQGAGIPVFASSGRLVDVSLLLRVEPGSACIEAASGRLVPGVAATKAVERPKGAIPLFAELPDESAAVSAGCVVE